MNRLFFRFLARLLGIFLLAALLAWLAVVPRLTQRISRNMEDALSVTVAVMVESIAAEPRQPSGQSAVLERAKARLRAPVTLLPRAEVTLPAADAARLDQGQVVVDRSRLPQAFVYARIPAADQVLKIGPLRPLHPFGEGRAVTIVALLWSVLAVGAYLLLRPTRQQLNELAQAAEAFGRGALHSRATVHSRDAIGALARSFNAMAAQIQALIVAQKELLWMVSHELRTPLQRVYFALEQLHATADEKKRQDGYLKAESAIHQLDGLIEELLTYVRLSHDAPLRCEAVDLDLLIDETLETQADVAGPISLVRGEGTLPSAIAVEPKLLRRALDNLIGNALRYAQSGVWVNASQAQDRVQIDVEDDGPGIPEAQRGRIFEPFMRLEAGRRQGQAGCGLGLSIVRRIVERHGGSIELDRSPLGGARFRLLLPAASAFASNPN